MRTEAQQFLTDTAAEAAVIGCMLVDPPAAIPAASARLRAEDFADERHAAIFPAIVALGDGADLLTVSSELDRRGGLATAGGDAYIAELTGAMPTALNVEHYAAIVADLAARRRLGQAGAGIAKLAASRDVPIDEAVDQAQAAIIRATEGICAAARPWADELADFLAVYEQRRAGEAPPGVAVGVPALDAYLANIGPGRLLTVAARPSVGKSAFMLQLGLHAVTAQGRRVACFSLEMPVGEVIERAVAHLARLDMSEPAKHMAAERGRIDAAVDELHRLGVRIIDAPDWTPARIVAECARMKAAGGLDVAIIDYAQQLNVAGPKGSTRDQELSAATRALKNAARKLGIVIVLGAQLNRGVEEWDEPGLTHLRESGGFEADSDAVVFLWKPDRDAPNVTQVKLGKNRGGRTGSTALYFDKPRMRFGLAERQELNP